MRLTLITETYAPQVNGVSRTLGQLVRHMVEAGDVRPGRPPRLRRAASTRPSTSPSGRCRCPGTRTSGSPCRRSARPVRRIDAFRPDLVHIATEATLGLDMLRHARRRGFPVVSSFHTNWDHYSDHYRIGFARGTIWRYLRWFHARTIETYVPSRPTIADLEARGLPRPRALAPGRRRPPLPPRPPGPRRRPRVARASRPGDVVIGHVSRLAPEKNVGYLADALAIVGADAADGPVPLRRRRAGAGGPGASDGAERPVRRVPLGGRPRRPLRRGRRLRLRQPDRDVRQRRPRGDGHRACRSWPSARAGWATSSGTAGRACSSSRRTRPRSSPRR